MKKMQASINLKDEIFKKLESKSRETGVACDDIVNEILNVGLDTYPGELVRLADSFEGLVDICDYPEPTDAVELKHMSREKQL